MRAKRNDAIKSASILSRMTIGGCFGILILSLVITCALFADELSPHDPQEKKVINKLRPPIGSELAMDGYLLGTDQLGRDLLSRLIHGTRYTLLISFSAALVAMILGVTMGILAGLSKGWLDLGLMLLNDTMLAVPAILIAIAVIGAIGRTEPWILIVLLGLLGWVMHTRVIRSEVISLREREFISFAMGQGAGFAHIMVRHILPNLWPIILVMLTVQIANFTLVEAALSYLGLGLPPGTPSWGRMVADGKEHMFNAWWYALYPGLFLTIYVTGLYLFSDWLREFLRLRNRKFI